MLRPDLDLCTAPRWRAQDLGTALPESPHAVSVCLPLWEHVIGYEENDPAVRGAMRAGYPRFVFPAQIEALRAAFAEEHGTAREGCLPFPARRCAEGCARFLAEAGEGQVSVAAYPAASAQPVFFAVFPPALAAAAKSYWQHYGETVSSRRAEAALTGAADTPDAAAARQILQERIAGLSGGAPKDVYLYPSGMGALHAALSAVQQRTPNAKTAQLGFPYVDVLKIQTVRGPGAHFMPAGDAADVARVGALLAAGEPLAGVICEFPGNPLLRGADLPRLAALLRPHGVPLIVDDTPGTFYNVDALAYADIVVSSLTKAFSGAGDVLAGSLVINPRSPLYDALKAAVHSAYEDTLWGEDAVVLERNSRDFPERMAQVNATTEALCAALRTHPAVEHLFYPQYEIPELYAQVKKPGGGYGGLFSLVLKDGAVTAPVFYDNLRVSKGPSLGNNFTMACPYTLLAHYEELPWAGALGVSAHLVRVSVGLEPVADLLARFTEALDHGKS